MIRYYFALVVQRHDLDKALREFLRILGPDSAKRVAEALPWTPAISRKRSWGEQAGSVWSHRGLRGLADDEFESSRNYYCLTIQVLRDPVLDADAAIGPMPKLPDENGMYEIGCVWTGFDAGESLAAIDCTAATGAISRLFRDSPNIRALFVEWAERANALALFFDTEQDTDWHLLYPREGVTPRPEWEQHEFDDDCDLNTDTFYGEALRLAELT